MSDKQMSYRQRYVLLESMFNKVPQNDGELRFSKNLEIDVDYRRCVVTIGEYNISLSSFLWTADKLRAHWRAYHDQGNPSLEQLVR